MKKITFLPRHLAQALIAPVNSVLISIYDRSEPRLEPQPGWRDVLYLRFHDIDEPAGDLEVFDEARAHLIMEFATRHVQCNELFVHCQAGQSRSAAVALFLAELHQVPCFKVDHPVSATNYRLYNRRVYSTLLNAHRGPYPSAFSVL